MSTACTFGMNSLSCLFSSRPNGSPPVRIRSRAAPAISGRDTDSSSARILRSMVGTSATSEIPCALSVLSTAAASNRDCIRAMPPLSKVSSSTHMPKTNVICRTSRLRVRGVKPSMLSIAASFPANARWLSTTPFGCPVEPDVKTISAAPSSSGRGRGGFSAIWATRSSAAIGHGESCAGSFAYGLDRVRRRMARDRHRDPAGKPCADQRRGIARLIGDRHKHRLIGAQPRIAQRLFDGGRSLGKLAIGQGAARIGERRTVGKAAEFFHEKAAEVSHRRCRRNVRRARQWPCAVLPFARFP